MQGAEFQDTRFIVRLVVVLLIVLEMTTFRFDTVYEVEVLCSQLIMSDMLLVLKMTEDA